MKTRIYTTLMIALLGLLSFSIDAKPIKKTAKGKQQVTVNHRPGRGRVVKVKKHRRGRTVMVKKNRRGKVVVIKNNRRGHRACGRAARHRR